MLDTLLLLVLQLPEALFRGGQLFRDGATELLDRLADLAPCLIMDLVRLFTIARFVTL